MTPGELFAVIESVSFGVALTVASDLPTLLWGAKHQGPVQALDRELATPAVREQLVERISFLAQQPVDPTYANPGDVALAIYLWLLGRHDPSLARQASEVVLGAPGCYYALRAAAEAQANADRAPVAENGAQAKPTNAEAHSAPTS